MDLQRMFYETLQLTKDQLAQSMVSDYVPEAPFVGNDKPAMSFLPWKAQDVALAAATGIFKSTYTPARPTVLNFASAKNPGGGVLNGAMAQEEDLCRSTGLYHELVKPEMSEFYDANRAKDAPAGYHNRLIISQNVRLVRNGKGELLDPALLRQSVKSNFITCPAPNRNRYLSRETARELLNIRAKMIYHAANVLNTEVLVLGAWGCGVFRNDPADVAQAFKDNLPYLSAGTHVSFAMWNCPAISKIFEEILRG